MRTDRESKRNLTTGPVSGRLFDMSWPMIVGAAASMSVPLADSYFLGRLGTAPLAAISFTFPVVLSLMSLSIGLGAGTTSVVSRAIGDGDDSKVRLIGTNALILCFLLISIVAVVGYLTATPLFDLLGAKDEIAIMVLDYMLIWYIGLPLLAVMMVGSNLLRSNGDARTASVIMIMVAILNVGIDPLLIFGYGPIPAMGVQGAALASLAARILAVIAMFWAIVVRDRLLAFRFAGFHDLLRSWWQIGSIAIPAAIGNAVNPVGITIVTGFLAGYGDAVVAGFGVATRIESFVAIPMLALSAAIGPVAGQNFGARKYQRVTTAHLQSYGFCVIWSILAAIALWFSASSLATLFTDSQRVANIITQYLYIVPISLAGYGITVVAAGGLNAVGRPFLGLAVYLIRTALLYVPIAWFMAKLYTPSMVFAGISVTNVVSAMCIAVLSVLLLKRQHQTANS